MATNENSLDAARQGQESEQQSRFTLHPLHEAAMRLADMGLGKPKAKSKDLIGLLLSHGARAWRQSQAHADIHLHIGSHHGRFPVILRLK
ncbi:hypothetical protein J5J10_08375 [Ciceribacter sp. L1K23]|uniref:hypothetical protein n=1 Tax=Ciceribacter sp. L1K23 TaxID=2820276 RepID=UPI001B81B941|nr:hypothetical protein [Ciceribacter sp. L1K23]MBR0555697.1 hypothetical protein [Ciceribacter sp. L1K23]